MKVSRRRMVELHIGRDLTEDELKEAWIQASVDSQRSLAQFQPEGSKPVSIFEFPDLISEWDIPLWMAKLRYEAGYLSGLFDARAIAEENCVPEPYWVRQQFNDFAMGRVRGNQNQLTSKVWENEVPRFVALMQVKTVVELEAWHRGVSRPSVYGEGITAKFNGRERVLSEYPSFRHLIHGAERRRFVVSPEVEARPEFHAGVLPYELSDIPIKRKDLFGYAELALGHTKAAGKASTIEKNYYTYVDEFSATLGAAKLNDRQQANLAFDLDYVMPSTMRLFGLEPYSEIVNDILREPTASM